MRVIGLLARPKKVNDRLGFLAISKEDFRSLYFLKESILYGDIRIENKSSVWSCSDPHMVDEFTVCVR